MSARRLWFALLLGCVLAIPALADTRVTLSQDAVALGDAVTLEIETDQPIASPDLSPLQADFALGDIDSARQISIEGGGLRTTQTIRVQLRPRRAGMLSIPALAIGNQRTAPLLLEVTAPNASAQAPARASSAATQANGPVFIETVVDDATPYVQQAVGVTLRLHYAIDLYNGEFRQSEPSAGGSLQPVGNDSRGLQVIDGRQYQVLERHYLLVPERSGALRLPGASFRGEAAAGFVDDLFGDGRQVISVEAPARTLQVRPVPPAAARPWLPARNLSLRVPTPPDQVRAGEAFDMVVELRADGATAAQLPELTLDGGDAQVFAEAAQPAENFASGRPQVVLTRRFSIVPTQAGTLKLQVAPVDWWDVAADAPRRAQPAVITIQVKPGLGRYAQPAAPAANVEAGVEEAASRSPLARLRDVPRAGIAILLGVLAALLAALAWRRRRARVAVETSSTAGEAGAGGTAVPAARSSARQQHDLRDALAKGDAAAVARLLPALATPPATGLAEVRQRLADARQRDAVARLEQALWGAAAVDEGLRDALRRAFEHGPQWRTTSTGAKPLLAPLYPER